MGDNASSIALPLVIQDPSGTDLPIEGILQFAGGAVTVTNDSAHGRNVVTPSGGGGGGGGGSTTQITLSPEGTPTANDWTGVSTDWDEIGVTPVTGLEIFLSLPGGHLYMFEISNVAVAEPLPTTPITALGNGDATWNALGVTGSIVGTNKTNQLHNFNMQHIFPAGANQANLTQQLQIADSLNPGQTWVRKLVPGMGDLSGVGFPGGALLQIPTFGILWAANDTAGSHASFIPNAGDGGGGKVLITQLT